jgi:2-hydroxy-4-(methylsulfanyl)butanoate S-methyltransferase
LTARCCKIHNRIMPPDVKPTTIFRHAYGLYPSLAMLAGMQLDVFTPLGSGAMTAQALADALKVDAQKLALLLYALVDAELLTVAGGRFANTPEADVYLVRGRSGYMGSAHELYSDLWHAALTAAASIRAGSPQVKHDFASMSDAELGTFFRGLHAGALATGDQLASAHKLARFHKLLDVGGGSGGLAIAACRRCPELRATIIDLPRTARIARAMVHEAKLQDRIEVVDADICSDVPPRRCDVAVLRNLIQVLGPAQARSALRNVGAAVESAGSLIIVGHVLEDNRLAPAAAVRLNLGFLSIYDAGQAYTEGEHRSWLAQAGFTDVEVHYCASPGGASIVTARKI